VQILVNGKPAWVTAPVDRSYHGTRRIDQMQIADDGLWRQKTAKTLGTVYGRAPYFDDVMEVVGGIVGNEESLLSRYNERGVRELSALMGIDTPLVRSSELSAQGNGTDLLIALVQEVGGRAYLAGGGAAGYQEDDKFARAGLEVVYQRFTSPAYAQPGDGDVRGLSVADALMNVGASATRALIG
jgi:hypothetical protein